jgi:acetyl-CoA carboxylase biotin carboxyl carrier protein
VPLDFNQLREFLEAIAKTDITDLTVKEGDFELNLHKEVNAVTYNIPSIPAPILEPPKTEISVEKQPQSSPSPKEEVPTKSKYSSWLEVTSPMVGTFYRAPAPGESNFVEIGDRITIGQVVCIIEAMKLMNEIEAEVAGEVMEIVVENGKPVEYGQTLMWINPN